MSHVAVVDYGMCNLDSVRRALEECPARVSVTDNPEVIRGATHVVLPGVGAFRDAMERLHHRGLDELLLDLARHKGVPFLGICLGMQLMASSGVEGGAGAGLGIISGEVTRLVPDAPSTRIPHVGWNQIELQRESPLFAGLPAEADFYFVHSYHVICSEPIHVLARTPYCGGFVSAISPNDTAFGVQFHPEKSQRVGLQVLRNFVKL